MMMAMDKQQLTKVLYSTKEVANLADVTRNYVMKLCSSGSIKAEKVGRDWVIKVEEVRRFLARKG